MTAEVAIETLSGAAIARHVDDLARLRIAVFREYPYLYEGTPEYERDYLGYYTRCPQSVVVLARAGGAVVGASTALPLLAHGEAMVPAFQAAGIAPDSVYYFGESVLLPAQRGLGLGNRFFEQREAAARAHGFALAAFCAVVRSPAHPLCPHGYTPHDAFWGRRGFQKHPTLTAEFSWRDLGDAAESPKRMVFWLKAL